MIKLEDVSAELKTINKEAELLSIKELIDKIDQEVKESLYISKPTEKKQLAAIKKYLNNRQLDSRPILKTWSPFKDGRIGFTNSYSMFILNKNKLPFNVSFNNEWSPEEIDSFLKNNDIEKKDVIAGVYPTLKNCIPDEMDQKDTLKLNIKSFLAWYKVQDKKELKNKNVLYNLADDLEPYTVDALLLKEVIDILQLDGVVSVEYYGNIKPCIIRTEAGKNLALLLPVKKY